MHVARILFAILMLVPTLAVGDAATNAREFKGGTFDPAREAPDFALQGSHGATLKMSQHRGKVVALAFGFTHCAKVCPVTLANLAGVSRQLGKAASDFQVVFVTVDPERDDAERLREYLRLFNPAFLGATGSQEQLVAVRQSYGITVQKEAALDPSNGYQVHHSSSIFLIDRRGKLRVAVPFGKSAADILHDVRLLLE
jgi:protein SCO1/2